MDFSTVLLILGVSVVGGIAVLSVLSLVLRARKDAEIQKSTEAFFQAMRESESDSDSLSAEIEEEADEEVEEEEEELLQVISPKEALDLWSETWAKKGGKKVSLDEALDDLNGFLSDSDYELSTPVKKMALGSFFSKRGHHRGRSKIDGKMKTLVYLPNKKKG